MRLMLRLLLVMLVLALAAACDSQDAPEAVQEEQAVQDQAAEPAAAPDEAASGQEDVQGEAQEEAAPAPAAVSDEERQLVIDSCAQSDGTTQEMCTCVVDRMIEEFSQDEFALMVAAVREDPDLPNGVPGIGDQRIDEVLMKVFEGCGME